MAFSSVGTFFVTITFRQSITQDWRSIKPADQTTCEIEMKISEIYEAIFTIHVDGQSAKSQVHGTTFSNVLDAS